MYYVDRLNGYHERCQGIRIGNPKTGSDQLLWRDRLLIVLADISWSEADRAHLCNSPVSL
jgi:hypothetical protein